MMVGGRSSPLSYRFSNGTYCWYSFGTELRYRAGTVPLSIDLSISCCLVILATFFFFGLFAGSVVVVVVGAAAGVVAVAGGAAVAGAPVIVSEPLFGVAWAITTPAGSDTNATTATAAAIPESIFMRNSNGIRRTMP